MKKEKEKKPPKAPKEEKEKKEIVKKKPPKLPKKKMTELTIPIIKDYINPLVTDQEAFMFLQLCKSQNLNPFIKEAYLVKYATDKPATMVVGKDVFTKRANHKPEYDGTKAGIIVQSGSEIIYREGGFKLQSETVVGGWAETYRKDRKIPFRCEVSFVEYDTGKSSWSKMPCTMIRKVALVQSLREAFPDEFQGLYDQSEMGVELKDISPDKPADPGPKETREPVPEPQKTEKKKVEEMSIREQLETEIRDSLKEMKVTTREEAETKTGVKSLADTSEELLKQIRDRLRDDLMKKPTDNKKPEVIPPGGKDDDNPISDIPPVDVEPENKLDLPLSEDEMDPPFGDKNDDDDVPPPGEE